MTNQELKQKAIEKAWIECVGLDHYNEIKQTVDSDGVYFTNNKFIGDHYEIVIEFDNGKGIRPKSLSGIEDNNGWEINEPDETEFENDWYWIRTSDGDEKIAFYAKHKDAFAFIDGIISVSDITHYQFVNTPKSPIF